MKFINKVVCGAFYVFMFFFLCNINYYVTHRSMHFRAAPCVSMGRAEVCTLPLESGFGRSDIPDRTNRFR